MIVKNVAIGSLHIISVCTSLYGLYYVYLNCSQPLSLFYTGTWFLLASLANLIGILSLLLFYCGHPSWSNFCLQYYYLVAWLSCICGYPAFVSSTFIHYNSSSILFSYGFAVSSIIPLIVWILRFDSLITLATQLVITVAACSHFYLSYTNGNVYCLWGAANMILTLLFFSLSTSRTLLGISPIEATILSSSVTSYLLANGVEEMGLNPIFLEHVITDIVI